MTATVRSVVAKGTALLDAKRPDWWTHVNLETLSMSSCQDCVLGQVFGDYFDGKIALFGNDNADNARANGFTNSFLDDIGYNALDEEWTQVIQMRRQAEPLADWERELLENGPTHYESDVAEGHAQGVKQGRADGFIAYRHALGVVNNAAQAAGITLTVGQAINMAENMLDAGVLS